ncbi:hypothetical protein BGZ61DRAFT_487310 [Ilyonectria robusta]|uniref:uncharacterized protein n=1 Tax=Ilyonectria robusta TaxID=1079257 RepID=UPI001E8EE7E8|nr:uncharacterized protein BGZ61DRAFT_487310 [Ilyonectria robusta]KAH8653008.1 hypothetical protein BGZ61DRAFT_487310 [Ilyonectria robusta]
MPLQCIIFNGYCGDDNGINFDPYSHSDSEDGLRMKRLRLRNQAPLYPQSYALAILVTRDVSETPKPLGKFCEEEEDYGMTDVDVDGDSAWYGAKSFENPGLYCRASTDNITAEPTGMRRTPSGMFMPYEEGESSSKDAILGRFIDTVNTARDMAYFIWNVGWRKRGP